jgi:hypothetical protein
MESSRPLAAGSRVATKSIADEVPRIAIDLALFETEFISVLPSSSHHPQILTHGFSPWPISLTRGFNNQGEWLYGAVVRAHRQIKVCGSRKFSGNQRAVDR